MPHITPLRMLRGMLLALLLILLPLGFFSAISRARANSTPFANWSFDFAPPSVSIRSPASGSTVSGTISIEALALDNATVSLVKLYKDGAFMEQDALPPFSFVWSTALEPNGSHLLKAVAIDSANNRASSRQLRVVVNNPPVAERPDIVVVLTDDQRWDTMPYMPVTNSRLYAESIRFTNAIASVPLCCPSRASIFTGLYSHNHGIRDNMPPYGGAPLFDDSSTIATWLDEAGYRTGLFGKYLNSYDQIAAKRPIPRGWDQFQAFLHNNGNYYQYSLVENGVPVTYGNRPEDYSTQVLADKAVQFIRSAQPKEPLFVYFAPFAPHATTANVESYPIPGPGDAGVYADLPAWRPASFNEGDVSDKPLWVQELPRLNPRQIRTGDEFRTSQLESLLAVDRAVDQLIQALIETGRYDRTVFVYMSDNGLSWGEHRWSIRKWCAYEECVRIPLWLRIPGVPGRADTSLVSSVDLAPTLAELAGARPSSRVNGRSMVDLTRDPLAPWRDQAYTEFISPAFAGSKMIFRAVRTPKYFYTEYANGDRELYDLSIDPEEELNRVADPGYTQTVRDLRNSLRALKGQ